MEGSDERQTQDERTREGGRQGTGDGAEEYTTYRETRPDKASPEDAAARREGELQPAPTRDAESDER